MRIKALLLSLPMNQCRDVCAPQPCARMPGLRLS